MLPHTEGGAGGALECLPRQCDPNGLKVLLALQGGRNDCFFGRNIKHRNRNNFKQTKKLRGGIILFLRLCLSRKLRKLERQREQVFVHLFAP